MRNTHATGPSTWEYTLYVPHDPRAVAIARHTLTRVLTTHRLPGLIDDASLLASELLGNAIRHTEGPAALKLRHNGRALRLGAWDTDPTPPGGPTVPDGYGLHLVDACADDWGWFRVNTGAGAAGKYVWCELGAAD
ncbi:ATP-binding protein [Streptomyces antnestii]|uniref:ATP-binding protein n=1 Tax=Streptomyces antnestii TaxID=2494256 RepID=A0A3S2W441_9ACTN|nr:ATP-binding protein [Streptomyces sp. San01]RVU27412.1 ATP-binding protein [Streptomyces sp. San01]